MHGLHRYEFLCICLFWQMPLHILEQQYSVMRTTFLLSCESPVGDVFMKLS
jgi:hypothetical protein